MNLRVLLAVAAVGKASLAKLALERLLTCNSIELSVKQKHCSSLSRHKTTAMGRYVCRCRTLRVAKWTKRLDLSKIMLVFLYVAATAILFTAVGFRVISVFFY